MSGGSLPGALRRGFRRGSTRSSRSSGRWIDTWIDTWIGAWIDAAGRAEASVLHAVPLVPSHRIERETTGPADGHGHLDS